MERNSETRRSAPPMRRKRSPLPSLSRRSYHDHGIYPHCDPSINCSITHHPIDRREFYCGPEVKIDLDVSNFHEDDVSIELRAHSLIVKGVHESRAEDGCAVERQFVRKFDLPQHKFYNTVKATRSPTGVLSITVSK